MRRILAVWMLMVVGVLGAATTNTQLMRKLESLQEQLDAVQAGQLQLWQALDARLVGIEARQGLVLSVEPRPEQAPLIGGETVVVGKRAPQLLMAPSIRYLRTVEAREALVARMVSSGLTGLHLVVEGDWYDYGVQDFSRLRTWRVLDETLAIIEDLRQRMLPLNGHIHLWLFGDVDNDRNPQNIPGQGVLGPAELAVYDAVNRMWSDAENLTVGMGWDCEEWLSREHAQWVVDYLEPRVSIRGLDFETYNDIADIPSIMSMRMTTAELEAFRARYPRDKYPLIISEDRARKFDFPHQDLPAPNHYPERHFEREQLQQVWEDCVRLDIMGIYGRLEQPDHDVGSAGFAQPFTYKEIGWQP